MVVALSLPGLASPARADPAPACVVPPSQTAGLPPNDVYPFVGRTYGCDEGQRCISIPVLEVNDPPFPPGFTGPPVPFLLPIAQVVGPSLRDPAAHGAALYTNVYLALVALGRHPALGSFYTGLLQAADVHARHSLRSTAGKLALADLAQVPTPADFAGEPIAALHEWTRRVEIVVPRGDFEIQQLPKIPGGDLAFRTSTCSIRTP
jgi:hypothetical protein